MADLRFSEWPFAIVPSKERATSLWADRKPAKKQIERLLSEWTQTPASTIHLLWADLGAGKTHTLYFLEARCKTIGTLVPLYVLLPTTIKKFGQLYSAIARAVDWSAVALGLPKELHGRMGRSLKRVLEWYRNEMDARRRGLAEKWVYGDRLTTSQCEMLGVSGGIDTADDAVEVLQTTLTALASGKKRVVLMIDEYQRVAEGNRRQLEEIGHAIHTLYNSCPRYLSLLLSCAMGNYEDYGLVLTQEIISRLSTQRIELPYLTTEDVRDYVKDLFSHYRSPGAATDEFFPLTESLTSSFAEFLRTRLDEQITPRRLNAALDGFVSYVRDENVAVPVKEKALDAWKELEGEGVLQRLRG